MGRSSKSIRSKKERKSTSTSNSEARAQAYARATAPLESPTLGSTIDNRSTNTNTTNNNNTMWAYDPTQGQVVEVSLDNVEDSTANDEAYARHLQREIEREERAMGPRPATGSTSTTRSNTRSNTVVQGRSVRRSTSDNNEYNDNYNYNYDAQDEDARLAQQLQDEELARRYSRASRNNTSGRNNSRSSTKRQSTSSSNYVPSSEFMDERLARKDSTGDVSTDPPSSDESMDRVVAERLAQEMDDADMAQRLALYEQEAESRRQVQTQRQALQQQARSSRTINRILPLLCCGIGVAVGLLFVLGVFDAGDLPFVGDDWVDPFAGQGNGGFGGDVTFGGPAGEAPSAGDSMGWNSNGRGITLEILNAMEDDWQQMLSTAVQNWDNGFPVDSLTLPMTRVDYDVECEPVTGYLKVCNGNYGATRWRGLNELRINRRSNTIVASAAQLNEFYLTGNSKNDQDQQLYTICHELGHGFGLPHWDEDFTNEDSGNCMDYTNNPGANMFPDASNFLFLADLYGGVNVTTGEFTTAASVASARESANGEPADDAKENGDDKKDKKDDKKGGKDRRLVSWNELLQKADASLDMPEPVSRVLNENSPTNLRRQSRRRRILKATQHMEVHEILSIDGDSDLRKLQVYLMDPNSSD